MRDDSFTPDDVAPMRFPFQGDSIDNSKDHRNNKFNMLQQSRTHICTDQVNSLHSKIPKSKLCVLFLREKDAIN